MAAGYVFRHAMKVRSALWTGRRFYCGMITATGWATACQPVPTGAITFEEREAAAYDPAAVQASKRIRNACPAAVRVRSQNQLNAAPALNRPPRIRCRSCVSGPFK